MSWTHAVPTVFFRPSAIELKLYRKFRADQAHNLTKLDHYPINIKGVMTIRVRVGPTGSSVVDACRPNCFLDPSAIELKLYRKVRADQAHNPTKLDHYLIITTEVRTSGVRAWALCCRDPSLAPGWSRGPMVIDRKTYFIP